jgi:hypothetical protein
MRYFTRARRTRADDFDDHAPDEDKNAGLPSFQVHPDEPRPTGILNANGEMIFSEPDPIGFRFSEQPD